jgi:hypothetical protein
MGRTLPIAEGGEQMDRRKVYYLVGIVYVIVVFILAIVRIAGHQDWGDIYSLGQLLVDAILLPVAIYGFIMAAEEFRKARMVPRLDLFWEVEPDKTEKEITLRVAPLPTIGFQPEEEGGDLGIRPVLINSGQAIALWYMLSFDVPCEICEQYNLKHMLTGTKEYGWAPQLGDRSSNWRYEILPDKWRVVFLSNGEIASFPGVPLPLGVQNLNIATLFIAADKKFKEYQVPYTIMTDQGHKTEGSLLIRLERVSLGEQ